jgi:hypothetical protein
MAHDEREEHMMTATEDATGGTDLPTPSIDPPEPPRPDELETWSPGLTDESGELPVPDDVLAAEAGNRADVSTAEPSA